MGRAVAEHVREAKAAECLWYWPMLACQSVSARGYRRKSSSVVEPDVLPH